MADGGQQSEIVMSKWEGRGEEKKKRVKKCKGGGAVPSYRTIRNGRSLPLGRGAAKIPESENS